MVDAHLVLREDLGHVLIEPVQLVLGRKHKLLHLGLGNVESRRPLLCDPGRRPDGVTRSSHRHGGGRKRKKSATKRYEG